jgi:hypothetical protein
MRMFSDRGFSRVFLLLAVAALNPAGCAAPSSQDTATQGRIPPQDFAPGTVAETAPVSDKKLTNDPSAPQDTPLCGAAAREAAAMSSVNYTAPLKVGNSCTLNACFDSSTLTYIAADGSRRVCR